MYGSMSKLIKKARPGRPRFPPDTVRANRVVTFVTEGEMSELLRLAKAGDLSMSAVCHQLIGESLHRASQSTSEQTPQNESS